MMDGDYIAQVIYVSALLVVLGGSYVVSNSHRLGAMMRHALLWGLIFIGGIAVVGLWQDIRGYTTRPSTVITSGDQIEIMRSRGGMFLLEGRVNGVTVDFLVDTGASNLVLSQEDARRVGLDPETLPYFGEASTANGTVKLAFVTLESVEIAEHLSRNVRASVNGGELDISLLGMDYLNRFGRISIEQDRLILSY